jgi:hypothetical protein
MTTIPKSVQGAVVDSCFHFETTDFSGFIFSRCKWEDEGICQGAVRITTTADPSSSPNDDHPRREKWTVPLLYPGHLAKDGTIKTYENDICLQLPSTLHKCNLLFLCSSVIETKHIVVGPSLTGMVYGNLQETIKKNVRSNMVVSRNKSLQNPYPLVI